MSNVLSIGKFRTNLKNSKASKKAIKKTFIPESHRVIELIAMLEKADLVTELDIEKISYEDIELLEDAKEKDSGSERKIDIFRDILNTIKPVSDSIDYI